MHRAALATALTISLALAAAAPAGAVLSVQKYEMSLSPSVAGSAGRPSPAALTLRPYFDTTLPDLGLEKQFATVNARVFLPREATLALSPLPTCSAETVFQDERQCPPLSQVATGTIFAKGLGIDQFMAIKAFNNTGAGGLTLLVTGESPLILREIVPVTVTQLSGDPEFGPKLSIAFPRNLQTPVPTVIWALNDLRLSFPIQNGYGPNGAAVPMVSTTGCPAGGWPSKYVADYTMGYDSAIESSQTVTTRQPCTSAPAPAPPPPAPAAQPAPAGRPVPTLSDLRSAQVFFRAQAALRKSRVAGRILSLNVAKVPEGAAVTVFCQRGCQLRRTRDWSAMSEAGGEVTWRFRKPVVIRRGARVVVKVASAERTVTLTIGFYRRGGRLLSRVLSQVPPSYAE